MPLTSADPWKGQNPFDWTKATPSGSFGLPPLDFSGKFDLPTSTPPPRTGSGISPLGLAPQTSLTGTMPTGTADAGAFDWGGLIGTAAPLVASLFGSNPAAGQAKQLSGELTDSAHQLQAQGKSVTDQSLAPLLRYLLAVTSGNPADLMSATAPERARVLDQYDTAKQTLARTAPRGGGLVEGMATLEAGKASDLSTQLATARRQGFSGLESLTRMGMQEQTAGAQTLAQALSAYLSEAQRRGQSNAGFGQSFGRLLAQVAPYALMLA